MVSVYASNNTIIEFGIPLHHFVNNTLPALSNIRNPPAGYSPAPELLLQVPICVVTNVNNANYELNYRMHIIPTNAETIQSLQYLHSTLC